MKKIMDDYRPRISVEISQEDHARMQNLIPWGLISPVIRALLQGVLDLVEQGGPTALALLITKRIDAKDLLLLQGTKDGNDKKGEEE